MMVQRGNATFHSGELAKATGVSADTIRHYEKIGVLPKAVRTASGYRVYPASAVERVLVVQRALRIACTRITVLGTSGIVSMARKTRSHTGWQARRITLRRLR